MAINLQSVETDILCGNISTELPTDGSTSQSLTSTNMHDLSSDAPQPQKRQASTRSRSMAQFLHALIHNIDFSEDNDAGTFGFLKKGSYKPKSNFTFEFVSEVVCKSYPQSSGFLISVREEGSANVT